MKKQIKWFLVVSFIFSVLMAGFSFAADSVNINTATVEELKTLQGVGTQRAEAIVKYREEHGPFQSLEELKKVNGIGDKIIEDNRSNITLNQDAAAPEKSRAKAEH
jgi:competence protein ComEA